MDGQHTIGKLNLGKYCQGYLAYNVGLFKKICAAVILFTKFTHICNFRCFFSQRYNCHVGFAITKRDDNNTIETEIVCKRCSGHLGHVFYNETSSGTERHCVNSISVR